MAILEVKKNKASGQKFINVPKDSSLEDGDYIEVIRVKTMTDSRRLKELLHRIPSTSPVEDYLREYIVNSHMSDWMLDLVMEEYPHDEYQKALNDYTKNQESKEVREGFYDLTNIAYVNLVKNGIIRRADWSNSGNEHAELVPTKLLGKPVHVEEEDYEYVLVPKDSIDYLKEKANERARK